jgi:16S rRNA (uracil1498-N3)-methyltransferase
VTATHFLIERKDIRPSFAWLGGSEHRHLSKVLRRRPGQRVWLADEDGNTYSAEIVEVGAARTRLKVFERAPPEPAAVAIVLAQSLLKARKMDTVVQKATELGVDFVIPLMTCRSIVKLGVDDGHKVERWRKIVREAAKQSQRPDRPEVLPPLTFREFLASRNGTQKLILTEEGANP